MGTLVSLEAFRWHLSDGFRYKASGVEDGGRRRAEGGGRRRDEE